MRRLAAAAAVLLLTATAADAHTPTVTTVRCGELTVGGTQYAAGSRLTVTVGGTVVRQVTGANFPVVTHVFPGTEPLDFQVEFRNGPTYSPATDRYDVTYEGRIPACPPPSTTTAPPTTAPPTTAPPTTAVTSTAVTSTTAVTPPFVTHRTTPPCGYSGLGRYDYNAPECVPPAPAADPPPAEVLAFTGSATADLVWAAAGLICVGTILVLRKRPA